MKFRKALCILPLVTAMAATNAEETTFSYGGFIKLDALLTNYSDGTLGAQNLGRDFYIPS
ncbi:MAG: porin, partial [Enterobacterales bacterium]|nr:porin [Enterobacterales bacterium]